MVARLSPSHTDNIQKPAKSDYLLVEVTQISEYVKRDKQNETFLHMWTAVQRTWVQFDVVTLNLGQVSYTQRGSISFGHMNEYLAIDSGGYLCTNSLCTLIAAWLNAFQRSCSIKQFCQCPWRLDPVCISSKFCMTMTWFCKKGKFLYSGVSNVQDCSKHFTPWQTCSVEHDLDFLGELFSYTVNNIDTHISTIVYSQVLFHTAQ